jgi:hypothetical protein
MHPDDVREFVALAVAEFRAAALASNLPITKITLENDLHLYVEFELRRYKASPMPVINGGPPLGAGLFHPDGNLLSVPDLATPATLLKRVILFELSDWDSQPPTAELLDDQREALAVEEWPQKLTRRGIVNGHPNYARPFFCRPGLREFHTHPQHEDEPWDAIRGAGITLTALVLGLVNEIVSESLL